MSTIFLSIYLATLILCFSTYAFYPVIIWLAGKMVPLKPHKKDIAPDVSIIIAAYNEAKNVDKKIRNTLSLNYPKDKIEILFGSDGSDDDTVAATKQFTRQEVRIFDFHDNRGKTAVQNDLVKESTGEILIFTDAASFLPPDAVTKLVRNFADDRIACVAGRLRFVGTNSNLTTQSQGLYWHYELKIRELESRIGSLVGVDGPLYAVRRDYYVPLKHNLISDLLSPLLVLNQGKKVILEPEAIVDEDPTVTTGQEFATRRRITLRGLVGIAAHPGLLNPLKHPLLSFQILFHKVLRWLVGPLVLLNGLACVALAGRSFFKWMLVIYFCFVLAAVLGLIAERMGIQAKILRVPYYFSLVNLAATMGLIDFLKKKQAATWTPVRQ